MGQLPTMFDSDWGCADCFIDKLKDYFHLNVGSLQFWSYIAHMGLVLTLIDGPDVEIWAHKIGEWVDTLDPALDDHVVM